MRFEIQNDVLTKCFPEQNETVAIVPDGIVTIGESAFYYCRGLQRVVLPQTVRAVKKHAFYGCFSLQEIELPPELTEIGDWAFYFTGIPRAVLPDSVETIGNNAFHQCAELTEAVLPRQLTVIENGLFKDCRKLRSVRFPDRLADIRESAFENTALVEVSLPQTVTHIGTRAFARCSELQTFVFPNGIRKTEYGTFQKCERLTRVVLPEALTEIGDSTFHSCRALNDITLPDTLLEIGKDAFFACGSLTKLVLPDGFLRVRKNAFFSCDRLTLETAPGSERAMLQKLVAALNRPPNRVVLSCPICGSVHDHPLTPGDMGSFPDAQLAAYCCVKWADTPFAEGDTVIATVCSPFCCAIGETFSAEYNDGFATARLLEILSSDGERATIRAEVLRCGSRTAFVERLSSQELEELDRDGTYDYNAPGGDRPNPRISYLDDGTIVLENSLGGGDVNYTDYLYTDEDGVDHLVRTDYSDFDTNSSFFGDQVLGLSKHRTYRWENGLLIDHRKNMVAACSDDVTDAVVPDGIKTIGSFVFWCKENLRTLSIPASVNFYPHAFSRCPNLTKITLAPNASERLAAELQREFPQAEIVSE